VNDTEQKKTIVLSMSGAKSLHIMVTDKNHHVRDLLQRELEEEGYIVRCADSCTATYNQLRTTPAFDLIILDPEMFHSAHQELFDEIIGLASSTPIILHTYEGFFPTMKSRHNIHCIAKDAKSIQHIKEVLRTCLFSSHTS
jgi:DNA-binding NtrC family response regulator